MPIISDLNIADCSLAGELACRVGFDESAGIMWVTAQSQCRVILGGLIKDDDEIGVFLNPSPELHLPKLKDLG